MVNNGCKMKNMINSMCFLALMGGGGCTRSCFFVGKTSQNMMYLKNHISARNLGIVKSLVFMVLFGPWCIVAFVRPTQFS